MTWPQYLRRVCVVDDRVVKMGRTEAEVVLALLLRRGKMVAASELIEIVWPDADSEPQQPEQVLYHVIWTLTRHIPGLIETNGRQTRYLRYIQRHGRCYMIPLPAEAMRAAA